MSDGRLTGAELEAIRERAEYGWPIGQPVYDDVGSLLAHADALTADLAAAEGERDGLDHVVACMKNDRLAYQMGVEDGVEVCVSTVRTALAVQETPPSERAEVRYAVGVLRSLLAALEGPPAPAAAREGE